MGGWVWVWVGGLVGGDGGALPCLGLGAWGRVDQRQLRRSPVRPRCLTPGPPRRAPPPAAQAARATRRASRPLGRWSRRCCWRARPPWRATPRPTCLWRTRPRSGGGARGAGALCAGRMCCAGCGQGWRAVHRAPQLSTSPRSQAKAGSAALSTGVAQQACGTLLAPDAPSVPTLLRHLQAGLRPPEPEPVAAGGGLRPRLAPAGGGPRAHLPGRQPQVRRAAWAGLALEGGRCLGASCSGRARSSARSLAGCLSNTCSQPRLAFAATNATTATNTPAPLPLPLCRYCITAQGGPLKVLLAWYDYPADPNVNKALVNNLDLQVGGWGAGGGWAGCVGRGCTSGAGLYVRGGAVCVGRPGCVAGWMGGWWVAAEEAGHPATADAVVGGVQVLLVAVGPGCQPGGLGSCQLQLTSDRSATQVRAAGMQGTTLLGGYPVPALQAAPAPAEVQSLPPLVHWTHRPVTSASPAPLTNPTRRCPPLAAARRQRLLGRPQPQRAGVHQPDGPRQRGDHGACLPLPHSPAFASPCLCARPAPAKQAPLDGRPPATAALPQVNATRVFGKASPQNYSLVVLGKFSGVLQSPYNPVGASNATSGTCVVNAPVIDTQLSVPTLTSRRDVQVGAGAAGAGAAAGPGSTALLPARGCFSRPAPDNPSKPPHTTAGLLQLARGRHRVCRLPVQAQRRRRRPDRQQQPARLARLLLAGGVHQHAGRALQLPGGLGAGILG